MNENYDKILKRINEIIKESLSTPQENTTRLLWFDIKTELASEFKELIDKERAIHLFTGSKEPYRKNQLLIDICQKEARTDNPDYTKLLEILYNSFDKSPENLSEYLGYFISKEDMTAFKIICQKLKVGPSSIINETNSKEVKQTIDANLDELKNQRERIINTLNASNTSKTKDESQRKRIINTVNTSKTNETKDEIETEFKGLIYLGQTGRLTLSMVSSLKNIYSEEEFERLLRALNKNKIFKYDELDKLRTFPHVQEVESIDDLVEFFKTKKNIDISALELLIPSFGIEQFNYLIDQLYKAGSISEKTYIEYVKNQIENNQKLK